MGKNVRVRIAPSPTGFAHLGTGWMALFNYAFAKKNGGSFILRLDDTDVDREVKGSEKQIVEMLTWLGLSWDEGFDKGGPFAPYIQSEKLERYKKLADEFVENGLAYEDEGAIRFKSPGKSISWNDGVRGVIEFPADQITDLVILKSNGYPTYHFASVVDDIDHKITHIIRGEEHISNTPRQIVLFEALGGETPMFAHLPTLRNKDKKKLSKRRDPVDLRIYQKDGYLPKALLNFFCLLGWSHPEEKEIFSLDEFVKKFDLSRVQKSGPFFNMEKLDWINGEYIRNMSKEDFIEAIKDFCPTDWDEKKVAEIAPLVQTRINKLSEFEGMVSFIFGTPSDIDKSIFNEEGDDHVKSAYDTISNLKDWNLNSLNDALMKEINDKGYKVGKFFMTLRNALSGKTVTPPINESIIILGKDETLKRLKALL